MTKSTDSVCFGCEKRAAGCGATCEAFQTERAARHAEYDKRQRKAKQVEAEIEVHMKKARRKK